MIYDICAIFDVISCSKIVINIYIYILYSPGDAVPSIGNKFGDIHSAWVSNSQLNDFSVKVQRELGRIPALAVWEDPAGKLVLMVLRHESDESPSWP